MFLALLTVTLFPKFVSPLYVYFFGVNLLFLLCNLINVNHKIFNVFYSIMKRKKYYTCMIKKFA